MVNTDGRAISLVVLFFRNYVLFHRQSNRLLLFQKGSLRSNFFFFCEGIFISVVFVILIESSVTRCRQFEVMILKLK